VRVYGRKRLFEHQLESEPYNGVELKNTGTIMHKYLETPLHALTTFLDLIFNPVDLVLLCNAANSPFSWLCRLRGTPLVTNVDGIERKRSKWNSLGKLWYRLGELAAVKFSNKVVADAEVISDYYKEHHKIIAAVIAYGASVKERQAGELLKKYNLDAQRYILYVSRLEPENNALGVVEAYVRTKTEIPLVIVGDAPYAKDYIASVKAAADKRVIFTGFQFREAYQELRTNCLIYIQATEVGGAHPALIEAMAYGNCVIANRVPEHEEVLADTGIYYKKNDFFELTNLIESTVENQSLIVTLKERAKKRALRLYNWDRITDQYENLFKEILQK
jgi:glycosyltransferase involved in cell wall biosynthesis